MEKICGEDKNGVKICIYRRKKDYVANKLKEMLYDIRKMDIKIHWEVKDGKIKRKRNKK